MKTTLIPLFSWFYAHRRAQMIKQVYERQEREGLPRDLEEVIEIGDRKLKKLPKWAYTFSIPQLGLAPEGIGQYMHDLYFPSPLTLASFKDDLEIINIWLRLGLGGACIKTVMKESREGNPRPRLQEVTSNGYAGFLNAMGLPGHGVEKTIQEIEQSGILKHRKPIGISIGGNSLEEYTCVFDRLNNYFQQRNIREQDRNRFHYFEINVSCPNTPEGQQMTQHPDLLEKLLKYMREKTTAVIGVKHSPDTPDKNVQSFAEMLKGISKTYINVGNTSFRTCRDVGLLSHALSMEGGGLSGPALFSRTREMVQLIAPMRIPMIATGGINTAEKVRIVQREARDYDAPLIVGMATAVVQDMYCIPRINRELAQ